MKILGILLSTFILIGCETTPPVEVQQPVKKIQENKEKNKENKTKSSYIIYRTR